MYICVKADAKKKPPYVQLTHKMSKFVFVEYILMLIKIVILFFFVCPFNLILNYSIELLREIVS